MGAAPQRLGAAHRREDPVLACDVVRRGDDAAAVRVAADDERLLLELRLLQLLDRREERVEIEVRDDHGSSMGARPGPALAPSASGATRFRNASACTRTPAASGQSSEMRAAIPTSAAAIATAIPAADPPPGAGASEASSSRNSATGCLRNANSGTPTG